ncbi:calcium-binding protein [Capilliphycus salinus ALCB114379]|uniref:calcium-binding protein n=1 Tax=Capilliphycus salinus TaxID=2768948 RepID=UPI0039A47F50
MGVIPLWEVGGGDTLIGGLGTDSLFSFGDNNWLFAGKGDDIVQGDRSFGRSGTDTMFGDIGNDVLRGFDGNDLIFGNNDQDEISGGRGNDTLYGGQGNDNIDADDGNDLLFGDLGNDTMRGRNGNDQFVIGFGTDIIIDYGLGTDSILLQGNITEADLEFVDGAEVNAGLNFRDDISINLRSTGETIAILSDITLEEFNRIKIIQPLII